MDADTPAFTLGRDAVAAMSKDSLITEIEKTFLAVPTASSARSNLKHITAHPYVAGTPGDHAMIFVRDEIRKAGIKADIDPQRVLLAYPQNRSLELIDASGQPMTKLPLAEAILPSDPTSDTWWRNHTFFGEPPMT